MLWEFVSLCSHPLGSSIKSQNAACLFLNVLPPPPPTHRANVEWKNLAKLVRIQINSSAWGSSTLHFYKCDPQTTSYELQTFLTSLFLQLQIFGVETTTSCRARFYGHILDCKWSHLVTFSAVYSGVLMSVVGWMLPTKWEQSRCLIPVRLSIKMVRLNC